METEEARLSEENAGTSPLWCALPSFLTQHGQAKQTSVSVVVPYSQVQTSWFVRGKEGVTNLATLAAGRALMNRKK